MWDFLILDENQKDTGSASKKTKSSRHINKSPIDHINDLLISMQSIKTKDKVVFYRLLATMTNAWMTLVKSVTVLEKQEKNPIMKKILTYFIENLKEWKKLSDCLLNYPWSFSDAEVWIIKSWETTGRLNQTLTDLAAQIEKVESLNGKIRWAMMYPFFVVVVVVIVVSVMMIMIVPKLLEIFDDKSQLPATTLLLMDISDFFRAHWILMIIWFVVFVVWIKIWKKTPNWLYLMDKLSLNIPVFGTINRKMILSKFSRIFAWLSWSWVSVVESLNITSKAVWNEVFKQRLELVWEDVASGIKMRESLDWDKLFPDMMIQMIQVWEQTAKLDKTIVKVADFYDEEVDNTIWVLNKLLEPFIVVTLAIIVWFIAIAIMEPIMWLADTIGE